jgi:hypothetical protein
MGEFGLFVTPARYLIRGTAVACLATLEPETASPYASMITVATDTGGSPLFLISKLAWHTRNLEVDQRASILFMSTGDADDPLALGRISLMGTAAPVEGELHRARFLARHPEAAGYAGFADFSLWRLNVEKGHYIGGFGRIVTLPGDQIIRHGREIDAWNAEINRVLSNLPDEVGHRLARLAGEEGDWRLAACDPDGCEIVNGIRAVRLKFARPIEDVNQLADALQRLGPDEITSGL